MRGVRTMAVLNLFTTPADRHREGGERSGDTEMTGGGGVLESGEGGASSRVEPMSVELEALKEKVRVLERDGATPSKFQCLVCQVSDRGSRCCTLSLQKGCEPFLLGGL